MKNCFEIRKTSLHYGESQASKDTNTDIKKGKVTALIDPSGCGKPTLIKSLNRMSDLVENCKIKGKTLFDGKNIYKDYDVNLSHKRVGTVFQKPNPFPVSIYGSITFGPRAHGIKKKSKFDETVESSLKDATLWDDLKDRLDKSAFGLSGG